METTTLAKLTSLLNGALRPEVPIDESSVVAVVEGLLLTNSERGKRVAYLEEVARSLSVVTKELAKLV
jgi:hypothetical protein